MKREALQSLKDINYSIPNTCRICASGVFETGNDWGKCKQLEGMAHKNGVCPQFKMNMRSAAENYGQFVRFIGIKPTRQGA